MKVLRCTPPLTALLSSVLILFCCAAGAGATPPPQPAPITADQFRDDVAFLRASIARMHPDPGFSTDPAAMQAALDQLVVDLPATLSRDASWRRLATLNPLLADGHFFIGYPDWRGETRAWLAEGGSLFPAEVSIDADGKLLLRADSATPALVPARIVSVNDISADLLVTTLQATVHGDTLAFRRQLLAQRWWLYYWKIYGTPTHYRLTLEQDGKQRTVTLPGSRELPLVLREEAQLPYSLAIRPDGVAVLTISSFNLADAAPFLDFTRAAFTRIKAEGVSTLEIDISRNGGGNDAIWLDGVMPYLATRPYRTGSTYRSMTRPQADVPSKLIDGEITTWRQPQLDNPLRFGGAVTVRIGPSTYSSAILFANVMRDFGFGTLVGTGAAARQTQSGGVRDVTLPHSGLVLSLPRFILDPPAGRTPGALLVPAAKSR